MFWTEAAGARALKERFVSDLEGTTMSEVATLTLVCSSGALLRRSLASAFPRPPRWNHPESYLGLAVDFVFIVLPAILVLTVLSDFAAEVCVALLVASSAFSVRSRQIQERQREREGQRGRAGRNGGTPGGHSAMNSTTDGGPYLWDLLTEYRAILCLYTFISILAVDFKVFPRRFAKAEHYGTGVMDVGVGSFVVQDALFSARYGGGQQRGGGAAATRKALATSAQLAAVGLARIAAVRAIDYHEHVGEYGTHWNFFLTLAVVKAAAVAVPPAACGLVGLVVLCSYQAALSLLGLAAYVNSPDRDPTSLLSLNKEGVVSLVGYLGLHCVARFFALSSKMHLLLDRGRSPSKHPAATPYNHFYNSASFALVCWALAFVLDRSVERVSRRSVNASYIFWTLATNLTWVCQLHVCRLLFEQRERIHLFHAVSKFAFLAFIFANVLTGLVNSLYNTLEVGSAAAICVLIAYMAVVCASSSALDKRGGGGKLGKILFGGSQKIEHTAESEL